MDHCKQEKRKINPRERANVFSLLSFWYTLGLFRKGFKKDLEEKDLYEVLKKCRSKKCGDDTEKIWDKSPSILRMLWKIFGFQYSMICIIYVFWIEAHSILQPYGMSRLISYFEKNQTKISKTEAYYCAGIVVALKVFSFFIWQNLIVYEYSFINKIRASLMSLLYRKALKLSPAALSETNLGNIVTIFTKDIHAIEENLWLVMSLIIFIIQAITVSYLLWAKLGNSAFIGLGLLFTALPVQAWLSARLTKLKLKVGKNSDERLQVTQETLSTIRIIKMYTWENFFIKKIADSRNKEVTHLIKTYLIHAIIISIGVLTSKITFLLLILSYIWMGYTTNTELLFYVLSLYHEITMSIGVMIPTNMSRVAQFRAAFIRINRLLQAEELKPVERSTNGTKPKIELNGVTVNMKDKVVIGDVSLKINTPGLTLVTGSVGSGKSTLLKTILKDYSELKGTINIEGTISYASQEPWLFPSSIKQNICFGQRYDKPRYEKVLKVCALEYDLSLLEHGDETILADRGVNLSKGQQCRINLARAVYKISDIYLLDDSLTALDGHVQDYIYEECITNFLSDKICLLVTQNENQLTEADSVVIMELGKVSFSGSFKDINPKKLNGLTDINKNVQNNVEKSTTLEETKTSEIIRTKVVETEEQHARPKIYAETKKTGKVEWSVYKRYFEFGGGFMVFGLILVLYVGSQVCDSYSEKLITKWIDLQQKVIDLKLNTTISNSTYEEVVSDKDFALNLYTILTVLRAVVGLIKFYALLLFCRNASINIHRVMSSTVVNSVLSFFDTHFLGNILNRFSYDLNNIDESIPFAFPHIIGVLFGCAGAVVLIASVNWVLLVPVFVFFVLLFLMRMVYMPTGRSLKRLEAATRSPLVGHINSSLEGLTTIRAFKAEQILKDEFDRHQDLYTSAYFTLLCTMAAFGFFMDFVCALFTIMILCRFVLFDHDFSAGNVGLALTQVLGLTSQVQFGIRQWSQFENHMTSVERVLEYTEIKQESTTGGAVNDWPSKGEIKYDNVTLNYESAKEPVLKSISFVIKPNQKVGIVGRTGAGKSSIISTLFRLYDYKGTISIDGVDISGLSLKYLRKNIAIIPQDPILFTGTIRENIDPYKEYTDERIWKAIEKVKIKHLIPSLDFQVQESGSHFSSGQKQLVCLARAAIGRCKIVVLDEATANMDAVTDKMLHDVIDDIFAGCTVLTIAHRLKTIISCDMVIVLSSGKLIEFDHPRNLINSRSGAFYNMCREAGVE